jgi:hypothetical protein
MPICQVIPQKTNLQSQKILEITVDSSIILCNNEKYGSVTRTYIITPHQQLSNVFQYGTHCICYLLG